MAYTNAGKAAFRLSTFLHGSAAFLGKIRWLFEKIVLDEPLMADGTNTPESRPVDSIDARITIDTLDPSSLLAHTTAAANAVATSSVADGTGNQVATIGKMVPRSVRGGTMRRNGGNPFSQDMYLEGALTETYSV